MARKRRKYNAPKGSTRDKGDVLEKIIAEMHDMPGVRIERNVFLPAIDRSSRTREIDVLITSQVAGFPVRIAIECKNEKEPTGIAKIGEFIDKLNDVGLPVQLGIFVSTSRFESGAIQRAKSAGVKTFLLSEVAAELPGHVIEAFQSLLYLLAVIENVEISVMPSSPVSLFFYDDAGKICGSIGDLVWELWKRKEIPETIGVHEIQLKLPPNWKQKFNGKEVNFTKIAVKVVVTGHLITIKGSVKRYNLIDAASGGVDKWQIKASFPPPIGKHIVTEFHSEDDLEKHLLKRKGMTLLDGRLKLPRIRWGASYWPPSQKALAKLQSLIDDADAQGKEFDWKTFPFNEIEGTDLSAAYEPIWEGHPYESDNSNE